MSCKTGDFNLCDSSVIPGVTADGGYAEYVVADETGVAVVPEGIEAAEAAPLLCAGVTVFNALRNAGARPGDLVVVQGVGGLGHLAIQYAAKSGFKVVAVSGSDSKKELATQLGAHVYVDASKENPVNVIRKLGGARVVLATAPNADAMSKLVPCLGRNGNFIILGVSMEPVKVSPLTLISNRASVSGWPSGTAQDSEDTLKFSVLTDIKPLIQTFPLEKAQEAYTACMENKARFRSVIVFE